MSADPPKNYGLAAVGSTGRFDVEIDEVVEDASQTQMSIHTPTWSFRFSLTERSIVARILSFLREQAGRLMFSEIVVGSFCDAPVRFIKDDEFGDRFFLRAHGEGQLVDFVLAADELREFTDAVAQAVQDLES